jgi:PAS domain S-box-containing protein
LQTRSRQILFDPGTEYFGGVGLMTGKLPVSPDFYGQLLQQMAEGVSLCGPDWRIIYTNPAMDRMFGYDPGEMVGQSAAIQNAYASEEMRQRMAGLRRAVAETGAFRGEWRNRRKDGSLFSTIWRVSPLDLDGETHWLCIQEDITAERQAQEAQRQTEAPLRAAVAAGRMAVWQLKAGAEAMSQSPELNRLLGDPDDAHPGTMELRTRYLPGEYDRVQELARQAWERGERFFEAEFQYRRPDGEARWLLLRAEILVDADAAPTEAVGVLMDVTDRKAAEDRLRLLAGEVDHRANNLLTVALATVRLSRAESVDELRNVIVGRIDALARAHQLISMGKWEGADIRRLVEDELRPFRADGNAVASGPDLLISGAAAQSLAVILHELATNAAKYGALSAETGRVEVTWRTSPEGGLNLRWTETGGPAALAPSRKGFGTRVIERTVVDQLHGQAELHWLKSGLDCVLYLPPQFLVAGAPLKAV